MPMPIIVFHSVQGGQMTPADSSPTQNAAADPDGAPNTLPDPAVGMFSSLAAGALSGDLGAELTALAVMAGHRAHESAQESRDLFEGAQARQEDAQIAAMREKADDMLAGALASGLFTIGEGAAQIGEGWCSFQSATTTDASAQAKWKFDSIVEKAVGTCMQGTAGIASGISSAAGESADILATQARLAADHAKTAADNMHDAVREADGTIRAAIEFYREYSSTQNQSFLAALHRT